MHILLKKWKELQMFAGEHKKHLTREELFKYLLKWSDEVKKLRDNRIKDLYIDHLAYFENIPDTQVEHYEYWYSLDELLEQDVLNVFPTRYEQPVLYVRELLWELVAFKSDRNCSRCRNDMLRVLTDREATKVFFSCDLCAYTEDLLGNEVLHHENLFPASKALIKFYNIRVG